VPEVRMTLEEYEALIGESIASKLPRSTRGTKKQFAQRKKAIRKAGRKDPKMAKALRKANQLGRTKAGKLRKGYTQAKIMKKAHQLRRKM
jgi:hypothetical protein